MCRIIIIKDEAILTYVNIRDNIYVIFVSMNFEISNKNDLKKLFARCETNSQKRILGGDKAPVVRISCCLKVTHTDLSKHRWNVRPSL